MSRKKDFKHDYLLRIAAFMGYNKTITYLLNKGVNVNLCGKKSETALEAAVSRNKVESVKILLEAKANINTITQEERRLYIKGSSLLHIVATNIEVLSCCNEPLKLLSSYNWDNDNTWCRSWSDEYQDCLKILKLLIKYGVDVNKTVNGITALQMVVNDDDSHRLLINAGAV